MTFDRKAEAAAELSETLTRFERGLGLLCRVANWEERERQIRGDLENGGWELSDRKAIDFLRRTRRAYFRDARMWGPQAVCDLRRAESLSSELEREHWLMLEQRKNAATIEDIVARLKKLEQRVGDLLGYVRT